MDTDLKTYWSALTVVERESFATRCNCTRGHLQNVIYGFRPASPELAVAIERESGGRVLADAVLAAKWHRVKDKTWPHPQGRPLLDLAEAKAA